MAGWRRGSGGQEDRSRTGYGRIPFAHHRKQNGGGEKGEDEAIGSQGFDYRIAGPRQE